MDYHFCVRCGAYRDDLMYFFNGSWICDDFFEHFQICDPDTLDDWGI